MKFRTLSLAILLLSSCQRGPDEATRRQLTRLNQQLAHLRRQAAQQSDTLDHLREDLRLAAAAANYPCPAAPSAARPRPQALPVGTLYGKPAVVALDAEMAEVLTLADSSVTAVAETCAVKAFRVCNGPSDATLDYCTCSHYIYLALTGGEVVDEYKLFRIGPFFKAEFAGWDHSADQLTLRIRHDLKGRKQTDAFRIAWAGVRRQ